MDAMNFAPVGSEMSLQLLSMPDLRAMLVTKDENERAPKLSEEKYGPKVLEGNWFNRRAEYVPCRDPWASIYETSYREYGGRNVAKDNFTRWDNKKNAQGLGARIMMDHHGTAYHDNMSTTYDLSYRISTKGLCGPKERTFNAKKKVWLPEQDFTKNYGNVTESSGLAGDIECRLVMETNVILRRWQTSYKDHFQKRDSTPGWSGKRFPRSLANMNQPDLHHLGFDLSSYASCPIAYKVSNTPTYKAEIKYPEIQDPESEQRLEANVVVETSQNH